VDSCYPLDFSIEVYSERYYRGIQEDPELKVKLTGNWETLVGEQDVFIHITEYENYGGYDRATQIVRTSEVGIPFMLPHPWLTKLPCQHYEAYKAMLPYLYSRTNQLNQEFAILPTAPPHAEGGIFELRTYQLKSGTLLEWENAWCVLPYYLPFSQRVASHILSGEEALKHAANLSHPWVRGFLRLDVFTKFTICGNTRK